MEKLQKSPFFIGQSILQVSEITTLDIFTILPVSGDYIRPRDSSRYTFSNILLTGNYVNGANGNYFPPGYKLIVSNPVTQEKIECIVVKSVLYDSTHTSVIVKSEDSGLSSITTGWKLQLSTTLDWSQSIDECNYPKDLKTSFIERTSVKLQWAPGFGTEKNYIRIKDRDVSNWTIYEISGNITYLHLSNLNPNTTYDWQISSRCESNKTTFYSDVITFETKP